MVKTLECVHSGIILKELSGILNVEKGQIATIIDSEKKGQYIIGINGIRCYLHSQHLDASFIPEWDKFAYFESLD